MNTLTADEMACVARETNPDKEIIVHQNLPYLDGHMLWTPRFDHCHQCRSQALAVVEWLADRMMNNSVQNTDNLRIKNRILKAIADKDITALQRMVLELRNPQ